MMWWYGDGISGWGFALMTVCMILFLGLVIFGVIALVRNLSRGDGRGDGSVPVRPTAEQLLAERFARGEIDAQEYQQRLDALRDGVRPLVRP